MSKARSTDPRRFGNPASTLVVLREIGIAVAQLDATHRTSGWKDMIRSRQSRAKALREVHKAAVYLSPIPGGVGYRGNRGPSPISPAPLMPPNADSDRFAIYVRI